MSPTSYLKFVIILLTYILSLCRAHRGFIRSPGYVDPNMCQTPLGDMGSCVSLRHCPEVLTLFQRLEPNSAKQYSAELQRRCGNRITPDQYPVVSVLKLYIKEKRNSGTRYKEIQLITILWI